MKDRVGLNHTISNYDEATCAPSSDLTHASSLKATNASIIKVPSTMGFDVEFADSNTLFSTISEFRLHRDQDTSGNFIIIVTFPTKSRSLNIKEINFFGDNLGIYWGILQEIRSIDIFRNLKIPHHVLVINKGSCFRVGQWCSNQGELKMGVLFTHLGLFSIFS